MANIAQFLNKSSPKKIVSISPSANLTAPPTSGSVTPASNQYAAFMWSSPDSVSPTETITIDYDGNTVANAVNKDIFCMRGPDSASETNGPQLFIAPIGQTLNWSVSASASNERAIEMLFEDAGNG